MFLPTFIFHLPQNLRLNWLCRWRDNDDKLFHPSNLLNGDIIKKNLKISKNIRDQIKKINVSINGETLRVASKSKNDLQLAIKLVSELEESMNIPLKANNFR